MRYFQDTDQISPGQYSNIFSTPFKYIQDTGQNITRHKPNISRTPTNYSKTPTKYLLHTHQMTPIHT